MKTNIKIHNTTINSTYILFHLSSNLLSKYSKYKFTPLVRAFFTEHLYNQGDIYNTIHDNFQIASLSPEIFDIESSSRRMSSLTQKLDYESNLHYEITEQGIVAKTSSDSYYVKNTTNTIQAAILFCDERAIYYQQIPPNANYSLPSIEELMSNWSISCSSSLQDLATYFDPSNVEQSLWSGYGLFKNTTYMTFQYNEDYSTQTVSLTGPDYTPFPMI